MDNPKHIAIIMDGNGRWANSRGHNRLWGHVRGAKAATGVIRRAVNLGIQNLTLYTFSTENWRRPQVEINFLMRLLTRQLKKEQQMLVDNNVVFSAIGDLSMLPKYAQDAVADTIVKTKNNTGMRLVFALNYSGRQDIAEAARHLARRVAQGELNPDDIESSHINALLSTAGQPDPDLIIRTSGEMRISNFYLWQAAYSELYFTDKLWPDFKSADLDRAIESFKSRERRFGQTSAQLKHPDLQSPLNP